MLELYLIHLIVVADMGELKQADIGFLVSATLNAMSPPAGRTGQTGTQVNRTGGDLRAGSLTFTGSRDAKRPARISGSLYQATFLCKLRQLNKSVKMTQIFFHFQHCEFYAFVLKLVWPRNGLELLGL